MEDHQKRYSHHARNRDHQTYSEEPVVVAEEFNNYFASVSSNTAEKSRQLALDNNYAPLNFSFSPTKTPPGTVFNFRSVSSFEIRRIILSMPTNKSPLPDKADMRIVKDCLSVLLEPLTDIINCSLMTSTFPDARKVAELIPLLKEGDHEVPSNNRPLSLLVVASKVCKKVVLEQLGSYLKKSNCLPPHQSGNRRSRHHSTETFNLFITDRILEAMDRKELTALFLLDLSKAFDSVCHTILLQKLSYVGVSPVSVRWFRSYLCDRTQYTRIGSGVSSLLRFPSLTAFHKEPFYHLCCLVYIHTIYPWLPKLPCSTHTSMILKSSSPSLLKIWTKQR